jgi:hypothetical protein
MTDADRPPLWRVMEAAVKSAPTFEFEDLAAVELRAIADWLVPEEPLYGGDHRWELERDQRQAIRKKLLAEADRAEAGG